MIQTGTTLAETPAVQSPPEREPATVPAEPATARALWPTFMRRTLAEELLHPVPKAAAE